MNFAPYLHLMWKEYRAIRLFWLSLVGIVLFTLVLVVSLSRESSITFSIVYHLTFLAPVLFALGCAGAAFASEHEDGTFEFLRAIPVSAKQVLVSKLLTTALLTAAIYLVLAPFAYLLLRSEYDSSTGLHVIAWIDPGGILGLWGFAALEAIAWATLFSLVSARPLVAICLAMLAGSSVVHILSWMYLHTAHEFDLAAYNKALPWRALVAGCVFAADVVLGLRWLDPSDLIGGKTKRRLRKSAAIVDDFRNDKSTIVRLAARPDRGAMLGHLFWQHWRQSRWLMLSMAAILIVVPLLLLGSHFQWPERYAVLAMGIISALMGSFVFLPDQEQRCYRFFVEHNVPPWRVWLTRELAWLTTLAVAAIVLLTGWVWVKTIHVGLYVPIHPWNDNVDSRLIFTGIAATLLPFIAGQWASMLIRSGLMAGFCGLLLASMVCGWALLMSVMHVSWWWSVAPIALSLLFATWLRSGDWIHERRSWIAHAKVAAAALIPSVAIAIAVPIYRVHQIPADYVDGPIYRWKTKSDPDQIARFQLHLPNVTSEELATGDLYRKANDLFVPLTQRRADSPDFDFAEPDTDPAHFDRTPTKAELGWLHDNAETIAILLEAVRRPSCVLADPNTLTSPAQLKNEFLLGNLLLLDGRRLESEGKLDEALDRYFAVLQTASHLSNQRPMCDNNLTSMATSSFREITYWGAQKGQTAKQIGAALDRLRGIDFRILHLDEGLQANFIVTRRYLCGDHSVLPVFFDWQSASLGNPFNSERPQQIADQVLWSRLLPWENRRALRLLDMLTNIAVCRFNYAIDMANVHELGVSEYLALWSIDVGAQSASFFIGGNNGAGSLLSDYPSNVIEAAYWFETTNPNLFPIGIAGQWAVNSFAAFELQRRATMLSLALEAYRLTHQKLPPTLEALEQEYLDVLLPDPYTGRPFVYFPAGIPAPTNALDIAEFDETVDSYVRAGIPCVWSPGSNLLVGGKKGNDSDDIVYYVLRYSRLPRWEQQPLPTYEAWKLGTMFPIPAARK